MEDQQIREVGNPGDGCKGIKSSEGTILAGKEGVEDGAFEETNGGAICSLSESERGEPNLVEGLTVIIHWGKLIHPIPPPALTFTPP